MLTKVEIARKTGLSRVTVSNILNGKQKNANIETLDKIAKVLNCTVNDLVKLKKEANDTTTNQPVDFHNDKNCISACL